MPRPPQLITTTWAVPSARCSSWASPRSARYGSWRPKRSSVLAGPSRRVRRGGQHPGCCAGRRASPARPERRAPELGEPAPARSARPPRAPRGTRAVGGLRVTDDEVLRAGTDEVEGTVRGAERLDRGLQPPALHAARGRRRPCCGRARRARGRCRPRRRCPRRPRTRARPSPAPARGSRGNGGAGDAARGTASTTAARRSRRRCSTTAAAQLSGARSASAWPSKSTTPSVPGTTINEEYSVRRLASVSTSKTSTPPGARFRHAGERRLQLGHGQQAVEAVGDAPDQVERAEHRQRAHVRPLQPDLLAELRAGTLQHPGRDVDARHRCSRARASATALEPVPQPTSSSRVPDSPAA